MLQPLKLHTVTLLSNYRRVQFATQPLSQFSLNLDVWNLENGMRYWSIIKTLDNFNGSAVV